LTDDIIKFKTDSRCRPFYCCWSLWSWL